MRLQTKVEEQLNTYTHGIGAVLSIIGLIILIINYNPEQKWSLFSVLVYGISMIILFTSSMLYHAVRDLKRKHVFRIFDHISIYLLIAGTYTPVVLLLLSDSLGWQLFWIVWSIALLGIVLKLFFTGRFSAFSILLYVFMGWVIILDLDYLINTMPSRGLWLMSAGGLFYTVGIIFYAIHRIPFNHVIWHVFVLAGAICHFFMILLFVI